MSNIKNDSPTEQYLNLDDMLQQDTSSFEYFNSLPESIKKRLESKDICSFTDMQEYARKEIKNHTEF